MLGKNPKVAKKFVSNAIPLHQETSKLPSRREISIHGVCFKCARTVGSSKKKFECSNCKKLYHQTCIPKELQSHIPNDSDDDLFVCHGCFAVEDDTDEYDTGIFLRLNSFHKMYLVLIPFEQTYTS
jgi:hypothetical protein